MYDLLLEAKKLYESELETRVVVYNLDQVRCSDSTPSLQNADPSLTFPVEQLALLWFSSETIDD